VTLDEFNKLAEDLANTAESSNQKHPPRGRVIAPPDTASLLAATAHATLDAVEGGVMHFLSRNGAIGCRGSV
jgi:hypothetical protein